MISMVSLTLALCIALPTPKTRIEPHADPAQTGGCAACHAVDAAGQAVGTELNGTVEEVCTRCHTMERLGLSHPLGVEPGANAHSVAPEELPLEGGRINCITCHDPHGQWVTLNALAPKQGPLFTEQVRGREVAYYKSYYLRVNECGEGYTSLCNTCHKGY
jgi:predicted CXXCH cytochrome family protein